MACCGLRARRATRPRELPNTPKQRFQAFIPPKLQTVAISCDLSRRVAKMCVLRQFNDKIPDYFLSTEY
jgi:hypothetical protein